MHNDTFGVEFRDMQVWSAQISSIAENCHASNHLSQIMVAAADKPRVGPHSKINEFPDFQMILRVV